MAEQSLGILEQRRIEAAFAKGIYEEMKAQLGEETKGDALQIETLRKDDKHYDFNVTRCRYAEMYRAMGLAELGAVLSCNRDGAFCEGYDPKLKLERTQTIMGGATHCNFRYRYED